LPHRRRLEDGVPAVLRRPPIPSAETFAEMPRVYCLLALGQLGRSPGPSEGRSGLAQRDNCGLHRRASPTKGRFPVGSAADARSRANERLFGVPVQAVSLHRSMTARSAGSHTRSGTGMSAFLGHQLPLGCRRRKGYFGARLRAQGSGQRSDRWMMMGVGRIVQQCCGLRADPGAFGANAARSWGAGRRLLSETEWTAVPEALRVAPSLTASLQGDLVAMHSLSLFHPGTHFSCRHARRCFKISA
jgi:hypothetical protein